MSAINRDDLIDGRYRIESRLGTGGMADVFLAEDQQLERNVALKLLHRRFAEDPGFVERFRREAQAAANLQHPNVVAVYDRGSWDGTYYIAMEYLQGRTLKQVIRDEAPLDPVRAIDIVIQVLKATRFAHRRGVIHRDLKPHNVMLDDQDHAKVTDFGIARAGASDMTETGSIMGTAQYLSPEQAQGLAVAEGSDLYSIGVILYECLTGHVPFDAESAVTIALKHVSEAPTPPTKYNPAIPQALEQTVLWALNKNPADRPQDADQFINVLESVRDSLQGTGGQVTASMTALGPGAVGPHPRVQLGSRDVVPASTAMQPVIENTQPPLVPVAVAEQQTMPPEKKRSPWWPWLLGLVIALAIAGGVVAFIVTRPSKSTVPVVVGLTQASAVNAIEAAGLNPSTVPQASTTKSGTVIHQSLDGGEKVSHGTTVTITVSSGPGSTTVPAVVQLSAAQAKAQLHLAGLKVSRVLTESSTTIQKGQATRTDPDAGTSLQTGGSVVLYISSGEPSVSVPDVTGETLSDAENALSQFDVVTVQKPDATATPNTVLSQSPDGGTSALSGSKVTLTIAQKEPTVTVPNLVGDTVSEATSTLTGLGLKYKRTYQLTSDTTQDGLVLDQTPASSSKAAQGSSVTLVIGKYSISATTTATTTTPPSTGTATTPSTTTTATTSSTVATTPSADAQTTTNGGVL